jgi:hypothetical protein
MTEVLVSRITADPDCSEITRLDGRMTAEVWVVPVILELADGFVVNATRKVHGSIENAQQYLDALPLWPTYPMRAVFDDNDELVKVVTRMVPVDA